MTTLTRPARGPLTQNRWGTISWLFMRYSALALIFLTLGHFALQHVFHDVHDLDASFVAQRWASLGWRVYDAFLLGLALAHGLNGLRIVIDDYVTAPRWNRLVRLAILVVGSVLVVVGMVAIIGGVRMAQ